MAAHQIIEASTYAAQNITISKLPFVYMHLSLIRSSDHNDNRVLDPVTVRTYLTAALQQYLGLTGTAVPLDILKVHDNSAWIRLPTEDSRAVQGALSQWLGKDGDVSWRVRAVGSSVTALSAGSSQDLFNA